MAKTRRVSRKRRARKTRITLPRMMRGGNNYLKNTEYPTLTKGYPTMSNYSLPDEMSTPNRLTY